MWSIMILYSATYVALFVIFYLFPSTFKHLGGIGYSDFTAGTSFGTISTIHDPSVGSAAKSINTPTSSSSGTGGGSISGSTKQMLVGQAWNYFTGVYILRRNFRWAFSGQVETTHIHIINYKYWRKKWKKDNYVFVKSIIKIII